MSWGGFSDDWASVGDLENLYKQDEPSEVILGVGVGLQKQEIKETLGDSPDPQIVEIT